MINTDDCWLYAGAVSPRGYSTVSFTIGGKSKNYRVHRLTYEQFVGKIPDGLVIDHLCRVHECINPDHLEAVTNHENILRAAPYRQYKTHCLRGHEYTLKNTINTTRIRNGHVGVIRTCRQCNNLRNRETYHKQLVIDHRNCKVKSISLNKWH